MSAQHEQGPLYVRNGILRLLCGGPIDSLKINSPWVEDAWEGDA